MMNANSDCRYENDEFIVIWYRSALGFGHTKITVENKRTGYVLGIVGDQSKALQEIGEVLSKLEGP